MEAKLPQFGGNPRVVVSDPDIKDFRITDDMDYIYLGCKSRYLNLLR